MDIEQLYNGLTLNQNLQMRKMQVLLTECSPEDKDELVLQLQKQVMLLQQYCAELTLRGAKNDCDEMGKWAFGDASLG